MVTRMGEGGDRDVLVKGYNIVTLGNTVLYTRHMLVDLKCSPYKRKEERREEGKERRKIEKW